MQAQTAYSSATSRWVLFFIALATVAGWAAWSVLARARQMRPAAMPPSAFSAMPAGQSAEAVVFLNGVDHGKLSGTLLQRESDTLYRGPSDQVGSEVEAELTADAAVVMGRPQDIVAGAVVQVAGALDGRHVLHTTRVVILTGYVRVEKENGERQ
jgi:hypothetical protein